MVRVVSLLAALAMVLAAAPAVASQPADHECRQLPGHESVVVCHQEVWFRQADTPVGNAAAVGLGAHPTWATTPPSGTGPGAATFVQGTVSASPPDGSEVFGATFEGDFMGDLDTLAVRLYLLDPRPPVCHVLSCAGGGNLGQTLEARLTVDGHTVFETPRSQSVPYPDRDVAQHVTVAMTGLHDRIHAAGVSTGPDTVHDVRLELVVDGNAVVYSAYRYDTPDAPSGMTFNATEEELGDAVVLDG